MPTPLLDEDKRRSRARNRRQSTHKFAAGDHVVCKIGVLSEQAPSEILRLLPDGGAGLQYRIRGERDGVERVVTESAILARG
ncbi:hypothetical protein [Methylosinus sp. Sm6]|uniref:hypothetical protein n=1 Tax=Methylosinus sp. Sm6 TaxID=2866948 RepID=UPI001C99C6A0|nr:hypothetical protein [Methylosinus sp. Sm6]MBY6242527.1 hypothetical protein [Methylosinus sp. Sm6]